MSRATTRATSRRRPDVTTVLAVALPLVTLASLLLVRPDVAVDEARPPAETPLTRAVAICPSGAPEAFLTAADQPDVVGGEVAYAFGEREGTATTAPGEVSRVTGGGGPFVAQAEGEVAPGLVAGRFDSPLASAECRSPESDLWFTGLGSGARQTSVLELVNPDAGPAVVDTTLYGASGVVDAPELRGVAVPGRGVVRLDLAEVVPRRDDLAIHVTTSRGRVSASVRDRYQLLGTGSGSEDWLPGQVEPTTSNLLLGLADGSGKRTLVLLNPGDSETRATLRLVTAESVFAPADLEPVLLPPQSVTRVSLTELLRTDAADGALGLLVDSPAPVTAALRSHTDGDLSHAVGGVPIDAPTTVVVPQGDKQVVLAGASGVGAVAVTARSADGEVLGEERIEVVAGRGYTVDVPRGADLLTVVPARVSITGVVLVSDDRGTAVVRLRPQVTSGLVASVRPGLP